VDAVYRHSASRAANSIQPSMTLNERCRGRVGRPGFLPHRAAGTSAGHDRGRGAPRSSRAASWHHESTSRIPGNSGQPWFQRKYRAGRNWGGQPCVYITVSWHDNGFRRCGRRGTISSAFECARVQQPATGTHARRIDRGIAPTALPRRVATTAAAGARLMADQHPVRAEPVPVGAALRRQDHPATRRAGN
jgi:hypothetical protein